MLFIEHFCLVSTQQVESRYAGADMDTLTQLLCVWSCSRWPPSTAFVVVLRFFFFHWGGVSHQKVSVMCAVAVAIPFPRHG